MSDTDHWFVGAFALWIEASADHLVQNGGHVTSPVDKKYKVTTQLRPPRDGFTLELVENTLGMRPVYGSIPVMEYLNNVNKIGIFLYISHIYILMNHIYLYLYGWLQNTIAIFLLIVKTRKMPNGTKGNFSKALVNPGRLESEVRSVKPEQRVMFYTKETREDKDLTLPVHSCYLSIPHDPSVSGPHRKFSQRDKSSTSQSGRMIAALHCSSKLNW